MRNRTTPLVRALLLPAARHFVSTIRTILSIAAVFAALLAFTSPATAAQTTLSWNPPVNTDGTPVSGITGYKLYVGNASRTYSQTIDVGNITSYTLASLSDGTTYYFAVSDYDGAGDASGYSNEVSKTFPPTYTLTATTGSGGTISPIGSVTESQATSGTTTITSVTVMQGATLSFSITPATGYTLSGVSVDGVAVGTVSSYTFTNVTANHSITATFTAPTCTITATAGTGGSISPAGATTVASGASQTYAITPATGYVIADVQVDGTSVGPVASYTFANVTANHTIAASFTNSSTIVVGTGTWVNRSITAQYGAFTASFDLIPNATNIDAVTGLSAVTAAAYTDLAAVVRFNTSGTIDALNGTSYAANATVPYSVGSAYHVRMQVDVSNHLYDVYVTPPSGTEIQLASGYSFRTTQNTVTALNNLGMYDDIGSHQVQNLAITSAAPASYTITATAGTGGSISPAGATTVASGASQTYTISPATGYAIAGVQVDGTSVGAVTSYTFSNVTASHTISATFTPITYTITATAGAGGSISPAGTTTVASGAGQTYTVTPTTGYAIANVQVDGTSVGAVTSYIFSNVTASHTIAATFTQVTYTITATAGTGGSISPTGTTTVASGAGQTYTVTPTTGYAIANVLVDGTSIGAVASYTFSNVTASHTIAASFSSSTKHSSRKK